jgi:Tfp pilus assembly protein PilX
MGSNVPQRQPVDSQKGERGSALIAAIMFMVVLFAITLAAAKVRVAGAKDTEDQNAQQTAYWEARSGAATVQASLLTDVPAAFYSDVLRARGVAGGALITAFDPPCPSPSCVSKPVMNTDGGRTPYPISECTSLLGDIDTWAQLRGAPVAESYAASQGYGPTLARVAVLREYTRQQMVGTSLPEPAYVLEFQIDAIASDQGRIRPSGTIMLSPARMGCETLVSLTANPTLIMGDGSSTLTATYQGADTVVLKDSNGNIVDTRTGLSETAAPQTVTFTVSPTTTTTYRVEATGSGGCSAISGVVTVIVCITVLCPAPA